MTILTDIVLPVLVVLGIVGCGLMAGLFFAFSTSVMPGLARRPPADGAAAMQEANRTILNPVFGLVFGGTAVLSVLLLSGAVLAGGGRAAWLLTGALLYLVGAVGLTLAVHVPMNNRLDALDAADPGTATYWAEYLSRWTAWNHVRVVASTLATAALVFAW